MLKNLELKLPPPLLVLLLFVIMAVCYFTVSLGRLTFLPARVLNIIGILILFDAAVMVFWSVFLLHRKQTVVSAVHPEKTSTLLTQGPYKFSRNPIYLGLVLLILSMFCFMPHVVGILSVPCCVLYLHYFQILPEERILAQRLGEQYAEYCKRVRRWL